MHILPGVDDGPAGISEAVSMCHQAGKEGCDVLVATPHQFHPFWQNSDSKKLQELRDHLQLMVGSKPKILLGAEIRVGTTLLDDLNNLETSGLIALAGSRYLLIELDREGIGPHPEELIHELVVSGWQPIVAHPEFIDGLAQNHTQMSALQDLGATFQVTAASITGDFGRRPQRDVTQMIDAGLIDFVASDAHGAQWRPPGLHHAFSLIESRWGEEAAYALTLHNPRAVIENRSLPSAGALPESAVNKAPKLVH
jgi:protein-tyrosine phosphatase